VSIARCCSVNAAFLFAEPRMLVVVSSMRIRFADISQMLRVTDPRSGARLCEAQHVQSMRMPINRIGMVSTCAQKRKRTENENKMQRTFDPCRWQLGCG